MSIRFLLALLCVGVGGVLLGKHLGQKERPQPLAVSGPHQLAELLADKGLDLSVTVPGNPGVWDGVYLSEGYRPKEEVISLVRSRPQGWEHTVHVVKIAGCRAPGELTKGLARARLGGVLVEGDPKLVERIRRAVR